MKAEIEQLKKENSELKERVEKMKDYLLRYEKEEKRLNKRISQLEERLDSKEVLNNAYREEIDKLKKEK